MSLRQLTRTCHAFLHQNCNSVSKPMSTKNEFYIKEYKCTTYDAILGE